MVVNTLLNVLLGRVFCHSTVSIYMHEDEDEDAKHCLCPTNMYPRPKLTGLTGTCVQVSLLDNTGHKHIRHIIAYRLVQVVSCKW